MTKNLLFCLLGIFLTQTAIACPTGIAITTQDCNSFVFHLENTPVGNVSWNFGDGITTTGSIEIAHNFEVNGAYIVTATFSGPDCPQTATLTTTVEINCAPAPICPTEIWSGAGTECGVMNFEIGSFVEGENVTWYPGDETGAVQGGHFFSHTYANAGTYHVCAFYITPLCPNGVELCTDIVVDACNSNLCPTGITAEAIDCNTYVFHVQGIDNADVVWNFEDGTTINGGINADHNWNTNGIYVVTAQVTAPQCPAVPPTNVFTFVYTVQIDCPTATECPSQISSNAGTECGVMNFEIGSFVAGENVIWYPGDESGAVTTGHFFSHTYANPGTYHVCAFYTSPLCPNGVELCTDIVVESCNTTSECPTEIWSGAGTECGVMNFEIGSFVAGESVTWYPGDETGAVQGGHFFSHTYANAGTYTLCAFYTTPLCPDGVELCTEIIVEDCNVNLCPTGIAGEAIDCDSYVFHIQGIDNADVVWNFEGGTTINGGIAAEHTWSSNGIYIVTAQVTAPLCPNVPPTNVFTFVFTVQINCTSTNECPTEIWSGAGAECGVMNFEIGSFVAGESVTWYPGDETGAVQGGHFFSHTYANPGTYTVCAFYTTPLCPDGVELCTVIEVAPCEQPCNEIGFGIDSYVLEGGTQWLSYMISNAETGILVYSGAAEYTESDPYFDAPVCLPDGCYYLSIDNNYPLLIGQAVNVFFILNSVNLMENATIIYQDEVAITYLIGVNTDCAGPPACEAAFEPIFTNTPGHIEFINNSTFSGVAEFTWDYGNGTTGSTVGGNVFYESNGIYTVCLTVTTGNCTNTSCQVVVVDNMETACLYNEVTAIVTADYFEPMNELLEFAISVASQPLYAISFETDGILNDTMTFCIPDGCYEVSITSPLPVQALSILCSIEGLNTQLLGDLQLSTGETGTTAVIGVNMDCTIETNETPTGSLRAFPNPANDNIQFISNESIQHLVIFDMTGKQIASLNPNQLQIQINTSQWASGLYVARLTGASSMEQVMIEVKH